MINSKSSISLSRRRFLEATSTIAGASVLASSMPWLSAFDNPAPSGNNASDRVRVGFIGVGNWGDTLLQNMQAVAENMNVEIAAVCDNYEPHYEKAIEMTNGEAAAFKDYREMFDQVELDAVVIATPLHKHAQHTLDAFDRGLHVFCEKAMARTIDDTKRMYDAHLDHDKVLLIGHQRIYSPVYIDAIEKIRRGDLGPITMLKGHWHRNTDWIHYDVEPESELDRQLNWRLYRESSGGMITELATHHIQVANWVLDAQPVSVKGHGSINFWKDHREVWDNFGLVFQYPDGTHFTYDVLHSNAHNGVQIQALGNKGTLDLEVNKMYSEDPPPPPAIRKMLSEIESNLFETVPIGGATWVPPEPVDHGGEFISEEWEMNESQLYLEAFIEFVRKGRAPEELTKHGYDSSVWALLAEESTYSGHEETLPEDYHI